MATNVRNILPTNYQCSIPCSIRPLISHRVGSPYLAVTCDHSWGGAKDILPHFELAAGVCPQCFRWAAIVSSSCGTVDALRMGFGPPIFPLMGSDPLSPPLIYTPDQLFFLPKWAKQDSLSRWINGIVPYLSIRSEGEFAVAAAWLLVGVDKVSNLGKLIDN